MDKGVDNVFSFLFVKICWMVKHKAVKCTEVWNIFLWDMTPDKCTALQLDQSTLLAFHQYGQQKNKMSDGNVQIKESKDVRDRCKM